MGVVDETETGRSSATIDGFETEKHDIYPKYVYF
jgi:hypothetical protein